MDVGSSLPVPEPGTVTFSDASRRTTLDEHGRRTVIGCIPYEAEPIDMAFRAKVGRHVEGDRSLRGHYGRRVVRHAAIAITALGDRAFKPDDTLASREAVVATLRMSDYMGLAFRRLADEDDGIWQQKLPAGARCPKCEAPMPPQADIDLGRLGMAVYDTPEPRAVVAWARPRAVFCGDEVIRTVTLRPAPAQAAVLGLDDAMWSNATLRSLAWVAGAICEVNGRPRAVTPEMLAMRGPDGGVSRVDFEAMENAHDVICGGPDGWAPWPCPSCKKDVPVVVDWLEGFF